jgi:hypothetical protein
MTIKDIIIQSCKFDTKNKDLIKKEGVVFTSLNICSKIIEKLEPKITNTICEPSVGKGIFVFVLLEYFRNKGETIENIKLFVENNLWCYDINADFINEFKYLLDIYFNLFGVSNIDYRNIICDDFLIQENKYDVILGNPPYVRIQNLDKSYLNKLKLKLESIKLGNIDLYYAFVEKALKQADKVGFIIPNSWIKSKSGIFLRELLKDKIIWLHDFRLEKIWRNISTYTCILIIGKTDKKYNFNTEKIDLSDMINYCSVGIATLKDDVYKIDSYDDTFCFKRDFKIEKEMCKKIIKATKSKTIADYTYIIYPYINNKIMEEDLIKLNYPLTYKYLLSCKDILKTRDAGKTDNYDTWYSYGRKQGLLKEINGIRILLPLTFRKSTGIYYIEITEDILNLSGIIVDIKEERFEEFIKIITSKEFSNYLELNNKILTDKKDSEDIFLTLNSKSFK